MSFPRHGGEFRLKFGLGEMHSIANFARNFAQRKNAQHSKFRNEFRETLACPKVQIWSQPTEARRRLELLVQCALALSDLPFFMLCVTPVVLSGYRAPSLLRMLWGTFRWYTLNFVDSASTTINL